MRNTCSAGPLGALGSALPEDLARSAADESCADASLPQAVAAAPWLLRFPLRSPTLPPATHTNAYVVGERELLIVDPGTPDVEELLRLRRLLEALRAQGRQLVGVLLTHHHRDHASGAPYLCDALGLPVWAHPATATRVAAAFDLRVDKLVEDGEILPVGPVGPVGPAGLRALHTPGHAPGHLCFLDEAGGELIAGDMVASVGTILVHPDDDGDMRLYLASLQRLVDLKPRRIWPAHGTAVADPQRLLRFYIAHRQQREDKVVAALRISAGTRRQLVTTVYEDTPAAVHGLAMGSLLAHLRKLQAEGRASVDEHEVWRLTD